MKIICDCGAEADLEIDKDSSYTQDEGWYAGLKGKIELNSGHDTVFLRCLICGKEIWTFV